MSRPSKERERVNQLGGTWCRSAAESTSAECVRRELGGLAFQRIRMTYAKFENWNSGQTATVVLDQDRTTICRYSSILFRLFQSKFAQR